ncbi:unnamed protein product [Heterobilharzia americana]|nr:unnamed protein product [Heterobilharzia americana]
MAGLKWLCCIFTGGINIVHCLFSPVVRSTILKSIVTRLLLALFTIYLLVFELYLVLPSLFDGQKCLVSFILLLIFVCFYVSVVKCISVDPSIRGLLLSSKSRPDWTYCVTCQTLRPPRAHHCFDCATCVLRRDHHCTIIAQCIGHANWRYFCNTIFYGCWDVHL